jgi:molybdopterin/thiamine biosynthesis adenylyltransferase
MADRTVTVIGAGSIGSYVADLLHRSGVHDLHVHDSDLLLPGNLVRHAASAAQVGAMKADAVRDTAAQRDPSWPITARPRINSLAEAVELLRDRDLVVDCTGDRRIWHLMRAAADIAGKSFVHVAVMGHGQYGRVDICPPLDGAEPLDEDPVVGVALTEWEGGCGDPVSPTPPIAVLETAAMGARFALRMLAGEQVPPAGESRALFPDVA